MLNRDSQLLASLKGLKNMPQEDYHGSRYVLMGEDDRNDQLDSLTVRLAQNFNQIVELLGERKILLLRKVDKMHEERLSRMQMITRGKSSELKIEAKALHDEAVLALVESAEKMSATKALLKKITQYQNIAQMEQTEKSKIKRYNEEYKAISDELDRKINKYQSLIEDLGKYNEKEKKIFIEIQKWEGQIKEVLKKKDHQCVKKAQIIQEEINKFKLMLKDNKSSKDRKKLQVQSILGTILQALSNLQSIISERMKDIRSMHEGTQSINDFDYILQQFEQVLRLKEQEKKEDAGDRCERQLHKLAQAYESYALQVDKDRALESNLLEGVAQSIRSELKSALLERVFLQDMPSERNKLNEVVRKCKGYKALLSALEAERSKLQREVGKIQQMKGYFVPKIRALMSEEARREELKKELVVINVQQGELEEIEKKFKRNEIDRSKYAFQRELLEREMDQYANKGNLQQFKLKQTALQQLDRDMQKQKQMLSADEISKAQGKIARDTVALHARYADLIKQILNDQGELGYASFLNILSKRLSLI